MPLLFIAWLKLIWVSLQFDRHTQRQKNKVYRGRHKNTRKVRVMTVWLDRTFLRPWKRLEACAIVGNQTLKETKHKNIYFSFQTMAIFRVTDGTHLENLWTHLHFSTWSRLQVNISRLTGKGWQASLSLAYPYLSTLAIHVYTIDLVTQFVTQLCNVTRNIKEYRGWYNKKEARNYSVPGCLNASPTLSRYPSAQQTTQTDQNKDPITTNTQRDLQRPRPHLPTSLDQGERQKPHQRQAQRSSRVHDRKESLPPPMAKASPQQPQHPRITHTHKKR